MARREDAVRAIAREARLLHGADAEELVHVGDQDLLPRIVARRDAAQVVAALLDRLDRRRVGGRVDLHEVTDGHRVLLAVERLEQRAAQCGLQDVALAGGALHQLDVDDLGVDLDHTSALELRHRPSP